MSAWNARWRDLAPALDIDGPRVRMGVLWAAITCLACVLGTGPLVIVFVVVAFVAASQACAAWRRVADSTRQAPRDPYLPVAIGGAVLIAVAGVAGVVGIAAAAFVTLAACLVVYATPLGGRRFDALSTAGIALAVGIAAASIIAVRARFGFAAALVLLVDVHLVEGSNFLIGSGARHRWEGPVAGAAAVAAMSLATSAVLVPPFRGASPWILGACAVACTGIGRRIASVLLPAPNAFVPAFRRLDGFLVTGMVWLLLAGVLLGSAR